MKPVLIGCEYSATERDAFRARGFDAFSCDLKNCDGDPRWHIKSDVRDAIRSRSWLLIILHVDCTAMGVCGNKHYGVGKPKHGERLDAIEWTIETVRLALENPASVIFPILRNKFGADVQYIQPWQHGHPEQKKTGLALWNLPRLTETNNVHEYMMTLPRKERERIFFMSPSSQRGHERSRAYPGIADAMAEQWGDFIRSQVAPCGFCGDQPIIPAEPLNNARGDSANALASAKSVSFHSQEVTQP